MKKLLVILLSITLTFSYASRIKQSSGLGITNNTAWDIAGKCFPSQDICNGVGDDDDCYCEPDDTTMYVGRFGASALLDQTTLEQVTVHDIDFSQYSDGDYNDYMAMNGNVFRFDFDPANDYEQTCDLYGDPDLSVNCSFGCDNGLGGSEC